MSNPAITLAFDSHHYNPVIGLGFDKDYRLIGRQLAEVRNPKVSEIYTSVSKKVLEGITKPLDDSSPAKAVKTSEECR